MGVSFKVSSTGTRYHPRPRPPHSDHPAAPPQVIEVDDGVQPKYDRHAKKRPKFIEEDGPEVSFCLKLFADGFSVGVPVHVSNGENLHSPMYEPKSLLSYNKAAESLFSAIENGCLPGDAFDDLPCIFQSGKVICEVHDFRNCSPPLGNNNSGGTSPIVEKVKLQISFENVVKDLHSLSKESWTYKDLLEAESRIVKALQPKLFLHPSTSMDLLFKGPSVGKLNLGIVGQYKKSSNSSLSINPTIGQRIQRHGTHDANIHSKVQKALNLSRRPSSVEGEVNSQEAQKRKFSSKLQPNCSVPIRSKRPHSASPRTIEFGEEGFRGQSNIRALSLNPSTVERLEKISSESKKLQQGECSVNQKKDFQIHNSDANRTAQLEAGPLISKQNLFSSSLRCFNTANSHFTKRAEALTVEEIGLSSGLRERFTKIHMVTERYNLNNKAKKIDILRHKKLPLHPPHEVGAMLSISESSEGFTSDKMSMSKCLGGGSRDLCKTRTICFIPLHFFRGCDCPSHVGGPFTQVILTETPCGRMVEVQMLFQYDQHNPHLLPTLPNAHSADLFAAQLISTMIKEARYAKIIDQLEFINTANLRHCNGGQCFVNDGSFPLPGFFGWPRIHSENSLTVVKNLVDISALRCNICNGTNQQHSFLPQSPMPTMASNCRSHLNYMYSPTGHLAGGSVQFPSSTAQLQTPSLARGKLCNSSVVTGESSTKNVSGPYRTRSMCFRSGEGSSQIQSSATGMRHDLVCRQNYVPRNILPHQAVASQLPLHYYNNGAMVQAGLPWSALHFSADQEMDKKRMNHE